MLKSMQILYLDQSCLVFVRTMIVMSYLILNIWVLRAVVLLSSVKRMGLPHGLITVYVGPTGQAHASISSIIVIYDIQSSDHFPLSICIDISIVPMLDMHSPGSRPMLNWGKVSASERSAYTDKCSELLGMCERRSFGS